MAAGAGHSLEAVLSRVVGDFAGTRDPHKRVDAPATLYLLYRYLDLPGEPAQLDRDLMMGTPMACVKIRCSRQPTKSQNVKFLISMAGPYIDMTEDAGTTPLDLFDKMEASEDEDFGKIDWLVCWEADSVEKAARYLLGTHVGKQYTGGAMRTLVDMDHTRLNIILRRDGLPGAAGKINAFGLGVYRRQFYSKGDPLAKGDLLAVLVEALDLLGGSGAFEPIIG